jgi:tRNA dimethylallyltransferase
MGHRKIILLFGPTASGKSRLAIDIAKNLNGEIVNADSMQVYKEIKILSARPNDKSTKHHLYGFVSAKENFSVGSWYKMAATKIKEINKKGKFAIVAGGTGLYFKVLVDGLAEIPDVPKIDYGYLNSAERLVMQNHYDKRYPKIFEGINKNDIQRVSRAISVFEATGITLNEWQKKKNKKYFKSNEFIKICLIPPKWELEERIKKRFLEMLKKGAIEEAKKYMKLDLSLHSLHTSNSIIGLSEIESFLDKKISMNVLKEQTLIKTRQYAKRQYTWQRGQMRAWKAFDDINYLVLRKKVLSYLSKT